MFVVDELVKFLDQWKSNSNAKSLTNFELNDVRDAIEQLKKPYNGNNSIQTAFVGRSVKSTASADLILHRLLTTLERLPERAFGARIIICDEESYHLFIRYALAGSLRLFYGRPCGASAIALSSELRSLDSKLHEQFPYLKVTDVMIVLSRSKDIHDGASPVLSKVSENARTSQIIDLSSALKLMGRPHETYDNVYVFAPDDTLYIAERALYVADRWKVRLNSVTTLTHPVGLEQREKIVKVLVEKSKDKSTPAETADVLVVDRHCDVRSVLEHAHLYGPYNEQESVTGAPRIHTVDELDKKLQLVPLTNALREILKRSRKSQNVSSMRRHLDTTKSIYSRLGDGYLMILRIELSLAKIMDVDADAAKLAELIRGQLALLQLIDASGASLSMFDFLRTACLVVCAIIHLEQEESALESWIARFYAAMKTRFGKRAANIQTWMRKFAKSALTRSSIVVEASKCKNRKLFVLYHCAITPHELAKLQALDRNICVMCTGIVKPHSLLYTNFGMKNSTELQAHNSVS